MIIFLILRSFGTVNQNKLDDYSLLLLNLSTEFNRHFQNFCKTNEMEFPLFNNPFTFEAVQATIHVRMELIGLQSDSIIEDTFKEVNVSTFKISRF